MAKLVDEKCLPLRDIILTQKLLIRSLDLILFKQRKVPPVRVKPVSRPNATVTEKEKLAKEFANLMNFPD